MEEATKLCDHVALLNDGQIVEYGTPKELCLRYNQEKRYRVLLEDGETAELTQSEEDIQRLAGWLKDNQVASVHSCEPTLETVFLKVTGRGLQ